MPSSPPEGTTMTGIFPKTDYPNENLHGFPQIIKISSAVFYIAIYKQIFCFLDCVCVRACVRACVLSSKKLYTLSVSDRWC